MDRLPELVGQLVNEKGTVRGDVVWWNRYRLDKGRRIGVMTPMLGVQMGEEKSDRFTIDMWISPDKRSLNGRFGLWGHEVLVDATGRGHGQDRVAEVTLELTGRGYVVEASDATLPTEFFFPDED